MKISSIKINGRAIEGGAWVSNIPQLPGVSLRVRGRTCRDARRLEAKLIREIPRERRLTGLDPSDEDVIQGRILSEAILLDWRGIENDGGEPLEFSQATAAGLIEDPDYLVFRSGVVYASNVVADEGKADLEADKGN